MREERRLRVFENTGLRRIFGPKTEEVTGDWKSLHSEELMICTSCQILFKLEKNIWAGHVTYAEGERCIHGFGWKA
jgi:hypothetical protein